MLRKDARTFSGSLWALLVTGLAAAHCGGSYDPAQQNANAGGSSTAQPGSGGSTSNMTTGSGGDISSTTGPNSGVGGASNTTTPGTDVCPLPTTTAMNPVFYDGVNGGAACGTSTKAPHMGYWFSYNDKSADGGAPMTAVGEKGGCGGTTDCAYHTKGSGFTNYGAGVGFDLSDNAQMVAQPFDATGFMGIQFFAKGTITGTRGAKYASVAQSIHMKFATSKDRGGDDFGGYCTIGADWTKCNLAFSAATRDGFKDAMVPVASDMLDLNQLLKGQLEFSKFSEAADAGTLTPVTFDVWIDNVSFY